ncbi:hypothetical protein A3H81_01600 [Candidatus Daviesbacteria bacterium RIFCSPLOWO2_02_FULL_38_18]|uniref:Glycosyl transferase group 1 n=1 Tax=Candidatus Daviesbacteria bacterium GW2011_GWF2_38_6 TaxID=1618432 RepID=A0A0G0KBP4_9BACT|nr:MAG: Glycosyl transferase group 1 [Candidatus Daviesbacteria bacterium GW2011_GWF2_38_6]OGE28878.1 MAG: hypothetical protein A2772_01445 [Candidatus Daviesbacteria bacterium RIFCSPHIGHO2_01_FULL_38_8b]OGE67925.1 MAG: hypothetical protein A3H81_01600 [Candidatus Daviesbacteria bacterium RIFCSPLOWO2_02_FULL_38_18]OGE73338.1 MAG: hypothetical protein A3H18_04740 [Candidatus Daviesbacteria bacterium RIFCSPLOWO2_12_FULL_38_10]HCB22832.1 hypothetical protein [Candidatus Daviesbacteria bacterium]
MILTKKFKALVITHFVIRTNQGPAAPAIFRYFLNRAEKVVYIELPFPHAKIQSIFLRVYVNNKVRLSKEVPNIRGPEWLQFLFHILVSFYFVILSRSRFDIAIACENLSFISIYLFRILGIIRIIIYYTIDYSENRYPNKILNSIYKAIDYLSCKLSDRNWVVTKQQIDSRKKKGFELNKLSPFSIVPIGYDKQEIRLTPIKDIDPNRIIFAGGLLENSGPQLAILALPYLIERFPKIKLIIAGTGNYEKKLQNMAKSNKLLKHIQFLGYVENYYNLVRIISKSSIGLAPYVPNPNSLSFNSDPSKLKLYLMCGVPVVTTKVTTLAPYIKKYGAGEIVDYNEKQLALAITKILENKYTYRGYRERALLLSNKYDINKILDHAFKNI